VVQNSIWLIPYILLTA